MQDDRQSEAVELLESILADRPDDVGTRLRLHEILVQAEWILEAEQVLDATPKNKAKLVPVLRARARILERRGRRAAAQAVREELLTLDPSQTWVILRRMDNALERGDARAARAALAKYEKLAEVKPGKGELRRARVARALGDTRGELASMRKAVDGRPWDVARRLALAQRLSRGAEGKSKQAAAAREEAMALLDGVLAEKPELHAARRLRDELAHTEDRFWEEWAPDMAKVLAGAPDAKHWPQASTVCLFDQQVTKVYPDTSTVDVIHQIWRILDEGGIERYGSRPKSGELLTVRTLTPTGEVLEPIRASGSFQMPGLSAGAHVEHAFKIEAGASRFQLTGGPFYFQDPDLTEPFWLSRWIMLIHKDAPVRVVERNMKRDGITKTVQRRGDWVVHIYTARNQPRIQPEPNAPNRDEFLPWVKIVESRSLDEIGSYYRERATARATTPSVARKAAEVVFGIESDAARARALFDFVQTHVNRASGGFGAAQILAARGGSKTTLLLGLLRAADVPHQLLLAAPEPNDSIDWANPEPGQFNTPLIRIDPQGAESFYLFANGHRLGPAGRLPSSLRGAPAFVCDPSGGALETLPSEPLTTDSITSKQNVTLLLGGSLRATVRRTLPAYGLYRLKELFGTLPKAQVRGWFAQQANQLYPGARVLESTIPRREEAGVPLTIVFSLQADGAIRSRGDGRLELRGLVPSSGLKERYAAHRHRVFDLILRDLWAAGGASSDVIRVNLGPYAAPRLPKGVTVHNRFGQFSLSWSREGADRVLIRRTVLLRPGRVRPRHFAEFRAFLSAIDRAERAPLVVEERAK